MSPEEVFSPINLINTRKHSHGDFRDNGQVMQALKEDMRRLGRNWSTLPAYHREALEMIQHKIGRILSGDPTWLDHWDDIAGYAVRVASILREETNAQSGPQTAPAKHDMLGEGGSFMSIGGLGSLSS